MKWWFFAFFLLSFFSSSQEANVIIHVYDDRERTTPLHLVKVSLFEADSLIAQSFTNTQGKVIFPTKTDTNIVYSVIVKEYGYYSKSPVTFSPKKIAGKQASILLDLSFVDRRIENPFHLSPCMKKKSSEPSPSSLILVL